MRPIWITDHINEVADWCYNNLEYSHFGLHYGGNVLIFYPLCEDELMLFRLKWEGMTRR